MRITQITMFKCFRKFVNCEVIGRPTYIHIFSSEAVLLSYVSSKFYFGNHSLKDV